MVGAYIAFVLFNNLRAPLVVAFVGSMC